MSARFLLVTCVAALAAGCVEQPAYTSADESDRVAKDLLTTPPQIRHRLDVQLDESVVLLGYDVDRDQARPGETVRVAWYWKCLKAPGPGWRLFTHVVDAAGRSRVNRDKKGPIREHFQPEHWRAGMIVRDVQEIRVPENWTSPSLELRVGLWKGRQRMHVRGGPDDGESRVRGPRIDTSSAQPLNLAVPFAARPPALDGSFEDEDAWRGAARIARFLGTLDGEPVSRSTEVRLLWDENNLYIAMKASDEHLQSKYRNPDDELWHEDAFEIMLDPGEEKKDYFEIQVSPAGVIFDSHLPSYRQNRNEWSSGAVVRARADGTLNDSSDTDRGWSVEMAVPFSTLAAAGRVPPENGDAWKANFFRIDVTKTRPSYSAWSPPLRGDFHALDRFGTLVFQGKPAPPDTGAAGPAAPQGGHR